MPVLYEAVIGLEVHAQLLTRSKLFCSCALTFGGDPNTHVCPVCLGLPGALPVLNKEAVALAVRAALALHCTLRPLSLFARKNYFYPDLPKGYQISQFDQPFSEGGYLDFDLPQASGGQNGVKRARIHRVHMEEDAGKNVHAQGEASRVDLNRAGTPLIEIVGEPDLRSPVEAAEYLKALREVLVCLGVNDGNLEEGSFRCDANISLRPVGESTLGTRVELKNINSFRFVTKALEQEVLRQTELLSSGGQVVHETRGWDDEHGRTYPLRSKEFAHDYRYFPDPDLPPLRLEAEWIAKLQSDIPELPRAQRTRFVEQLGLSVSAAAVLTQHPKLAAFFEEAVRLQGDPVKVGNFVQTEVLRDVTFHGLSAHLPVSPQQIVSLLRQVEQGSLSGKQAKEVYTRMRGTNTLPETIVKELGMLQVSDEAVLEEVARKVVESHPKQAAAVRGGQKGVVGFFVGEVMKKMGGSANPATLNQVLQRIFFPPA